MRRELDPILAAIRQRLPNAVEVSGAEQVYTVALSTTEGAEAASRQVDAAINAMHKPPLRGDGFSLRLQALRPWRIVRRADGWWVTLTFEFAQVPDEVPEAYVAPAPVPAPALSPPREVAEGGPRRTKTGYQAGGRDAE